MINTLIQLLFSLITNLFSPYSAFIATILQESCQFLCIFVYINLSPPHSREERGISLLFFGPSRSSSRKLYSCCNFQTLSGTFLLYSRSHQGTSSIFYSPSSTDLSER